MNEEERRKYEAFQYWIQTNTEKGVTTIPDTLCLFVVNLINKLQKENEKLKEERQIVGIPVKNKRDGRIGIVLHQWESGSVAVLESINPRVINTHDSWNTLEIVTDEVKQTQTKCETIPVQIIEDFIKEYQKLGDEFYEKFLETNRTDKDLHDAGLACDAKVDVLKKVLKEGKEFNKAAEEIDKYCKNGGENNDKSNKKQTRKNK